MYKSIIIFGCIMVALAYAEDASLSRCLPICRKDVPSKIVCARDGKLCRRIRLCSLLEENCRRRGSPREPLITTSSEACRNIETPLGSGTCAPIHNCDRIPCTIPREQFNCYRSRLNNCQLLTPCQLARVNCHRGPGNHLERTSYRACTGMRAGQALQKCRPTERHQHHIGDWK